MSCTIIVGGQYGSEGKGKVLTAIIRKSYDKNPYLVRCGGPNAGHTHQINGKEVVFRQVPASDNSGARMFLAAGSVINPAILIEELTTLGFPEIIVDPRAVLIYKKDSVEEDVLVSTIGSTGSGTGQALIKRMLRQDQHLAGDHLLDWSIPKLKVEIVAPHLHHKLDQNGHVIIEGT